MDKIYLDEDFYDEDYLEHHGVRGMRWGYRRYQNPDGSLTPLGRERRRIKSVRSDFKRGAKRVKRDAKKFAKVAGKHIRRGAKAAGRGAKVAAEATSEGIKRGAKLAARKREEAVQAKRAKQEAKARKHEEAVQAKKAKQEAKVRQREAVKQAKIAKENEEIQKAIERAIAYGDSATLYKYRNRMSTEQLRDIGNRLSAMKTISDSIPKKAKKDPLAALKTATAINNTIGNFRKSVNNLKGKGGNDGKKDKNNNNNNSNEGGKKNKSNNTSSNNQSTADRIAKLLAEASNAQNTSSTRSSATPGSVSFTKRVNNFLDTLSDDNTRYASSYGLRSGSNTRAMMRGLGDMFESSYNSYGSSYRRKKKKRSINDRLNALYDWD